MTSLGLADGRPQDRVDDLVDELTRDFDRISTA
jgi:hypothetical protein